MKTVKLFLACLTLITLTTMNTFAQGGKTLPSATVKTLTGKEVKLTDVVKKDKITVISFWATWCSPCKKELDNLVDLYPEWKEDMNVEIIAVSTDDSRTAPRVRSTVKAKGWDYTVLMDGNQELQRALNINSVPFTVIVKNNKVVYTHTGYKEGDEYDLEDELKKLAK